jgi:hypothetical protein
MRPDTRIRSFYKGGLEVEQSREEDKSIESILLA